jgi:hypothetical protein
MTVGFLGEAVSASRKGVSLASAALGELRHRKKITGDDAVSRAVLIHQVQDQGIEAVRPGAARDDYDQHKGVKRLR